MKWIIFHKKTLLEQNDYPQCSCCSDNERTELILCRVRMDPCYSYQTCLILCREKIGSMLLTPNMPNPGRSDYCRGSRFTKRMFPNLHWGARSGNILLVIKKNTTARLCTFGTCLSLYIWQRRMLPWSLINAAWVALSNLPQYMCWSNAPYNEMRKWYILWDPITEQHSMPE